MLLAIRIDIAALVGCALQDVSLANESAALFLRASAIGNVSLSVTLPADAAATLVAHVSQGDVVRLGQVPVDGAVMAEPAVVDAQVGR